jgi:SAM-dependent methyltransferase
MPMDAREMTRATGLSRAHFRQIAHNGLGDPHNGYFQSMAWFKDCLYVGSTRDNLALLNVGWKKVDRKNTLPVWPVRVPDDVLDLDLRSQIWRYNPRNRVWRQVAYSPMITREDGKVVPSSVGFRTMAVFQGKSDPEPALYAPTWATSLWPHTLLMRSLDGDNWEVVGPRGLGLPDPQPRCIRGFIAFKGRLFAAPAQGQDPGQPQMAGQAIVACTDDPVNGKWVAASEHGFGDPNNLSVYELGIFKDRLYAGTLNPVEGFQIWRTDAEGEPPFQWTLVLSHGAYRGKLNEGAMTFCEFDDHLYIGSAIQFGGFDPDFQVGPAPPEVVRVRYDDTWDLVCGEARLTPDGLKVPISGMGPAFGNLCASYLWRMCAHDGWIYSADAVSSPFLRFTDESRWTPALRFFMDRYIRERGGFNIWRSKDGVTWYPITRDGFDNPLSLGVRTMASTPYGLFVGVGNPFGPDVAVQRAAGWVYEPNPKGGAEVWHGSHEYIEDTLARAEPDGLTPEILGAQSVAQLIDGFYEHSGFRHRGWWRTGVRTARAGAENLVEELLAFLPERAGVIADVHCGAGGTTAYLTRHFAPEDIVAVAADRADARACAERVPAVRVVQTRLPKLRLDDASVDIVFCAEGIVELADKAAWLREAFRALRPKGRLLLSDMLFHDLDAPSGRWPWSRRSEPRTPEDYLSLVEQAGFEEVRVIPAPQPVLAGFDEGVARYFWTKVLLDEIDEETHREILAALPGGGKPLEHYLLISGVKPG